MLDACETTTRDHKKGLTCARAQRWYRYAKEEELKLSKKQRAEQCVNQKGDH